MSSEDYENLTKFIYHLREVIPGMGGGQADILVFQKDLDALEAALLCIESEKAARDKD